MYLFRYTVPDYTGKHQNKSPRHPVPGSDKNAICKQRDTQQICEAARKPKGALYLFRYMIPDDTGNYQKKSPRHAVLPGSDKTANCKQRSKQEGNLRSCETAQGAMHLFRYTVTGKFKKESLSHVVLPANSDLVQIFSKTQP